MDTSSSPPSGRGGRPTLEMVAARAGVSRGTASRVLSGASNVSPHAVEAVRAAAAELHYRPNLVARSLVTGRTGLVGLVLGQGLERLWSDPFHQAIARGAHQLLQAAGSALVLSLVDENTEPDTLLDLVSTRLDAVLVVRGPGDDALLRGIADAGIPSCLAGPKIPSLADRVSSVSFDNIGGGRMAVDHLVERGRSCIGTVTGPLSNPASTERLRGWREALEAVGLEAGDDLVAHGDWSVQSGHTAALALLARRPDIDAIYCANDLMAIGVMRAVHESGRSVPGDVSVVGFSDLVGADTEPPLTTVRVGIDEMGGRMAAIVLGQLDGRGVQHEVLPVELVVRASS